MFNVCPGCGEYSDDKRIDPSGPYAVCPHCGYRHPFLQLPLFVVTGASGAGKTAVCLRLAQATRRCVVMESDILWRTEFASAGDDYRSYRNLWLRLAKNIGQAGKPVVLCGSAVPEQFEDCAERRYFTDLHYLALVCSPETLGARLRARPAWRGTASPEFVARMIDFNAWLIGNASRTRPAMHLLDTTALPVAESASAVLDWVLAHLPAENRV